MTWATPGAWSNTQQTSVSDPPSAFGAPGGGPISGIEPWLGGPSGGGGGAGGQFNWGDTPGGGWYDPNNLYGGQQPGPNTGGSTLPTLSDYLQRMNFQIAYDYATQGQGLNPKGAFSNYVRSQQDMLQRAYNAALVSNPDLTHQQFLSGYGNGTGLLPQLQQNFQSLPYQLRGEDPRQWGQGTQGWVPRV